jgi:hypothetical protein
MRLVALERGRQGIMGNYLFAKIESDLFSLLFLILRINFGLKNTGNPEIIIKSRKIPRRLRKF